MSKCGCCLGLQIPLLALQPLDDILLVGAGVARRAVCVGSVLVGMRWVSEWEGIATRVRK